MFSLPTSLIPTATTTSTFSRRFSSPLLTTTLQAICINVLANILAQLIEHRKIAQALASARHPDALESLALGEVGDVGRAFRVDVLRVAQFVLWTALSVPPNFRWQVWLERRFPAYYGDEEGGVGDGRGMGKGKGKGREGLPVVEVGIGEEGAVKPRKRNFKHTFLKILCDQGCAAPINCSSFLFVMTLLKGGGIADAVLMVRKKFWPLKFAGWRLWPMVGLINFTFVPVDRRVIVSTLVGLCWNVFLALFIS